MRENFQQKKPTQHSKKERERERGERGKNQSKKKKTSETYLMKKMIEETFL
jgi:hypothetical protein